MEATAANISTQHDVTAAPGARLHRLRVRPEKAWARIAFLPGYGDHAMRYLRFYEWLADRGVETHAIDFRGNGVSSGRRGFVHRWEEYLDDLAALMKASFASAPPDFVIAHSHGALVATAAALQGKLPCGGCILMSPYFQLRLNARPIVQTFAHISNWISPAWKFKSAVGAELLTRDEEMAEETRKDPLCLGIATPRWYVTSCRVQQDVLRRAGEFTLPLLMLIPEADAIISTAAAEDFARRASSMDKTVKICPQHRHELLREIGREQVYQDIYDWLRARSTI